MPAALAYHIHVDAQGPLDQGLEAKLKELGFWDADFDHLPEADGYEPLRHLTQKPSTRAEQRQLLEEVRSYVEVHPGELIGYIECEGIVKREKYDYQPFDPAVPIPFRFHVGPLPKGMFRQDEIHIALDRDESDERLMAALKSLGFHVAYLRDEGRVRAIYTVQGYVREIEQLWPALNTYLQEAGGIARGSMKEEVITDWWASSPEIPLPPIISRIEWR